MTTFRLLGMFCRGVVKYWRLIKQMPPTSFEEKVSAFRESFKI